jgi:hypothetical protein
MALQVRVGQVTTAQEYQGLIEVVAMIARHPEFPGKYDAVNECVEDILNRSRQGRLTPVQRAELLKILLAHRSHQESLEETRTTSTEKRVPEPVLADCDGVGNTSWPPSWARSD